MQAVAGLITALNLVLSIVVGLRLFARARRDGWPAPEASLALYFLLSAVLSTPPQLVVYAGLADPTLAVSDDVARPLLAFAVLAMALGNAGVYVFLWKTFYPESGAARALVAVGCAALFGGYALEAVQEGFAPVIFAGAGHWIGWAGRSAAMLAACVLSIRYWAMMRRRVALGLADPVVANRFLLWGIWAAAGFLNFFADLAARGTYVLLSGTTTEMIPEILAPIIWTTVLATMLLGAVSAVTLFLTFFPTEGYRRWLERRAVVAG